MRSHCISTPARVLQSENTSIYVNDVWGSGLTGCASTAPLAIMIGDQQQDEASRAARRLRIIVFPWLAFGHPKRLAARGHAVIFLSMSRNVARLPPVPVAALSGRVQTVALTLLLVEGLPDGTVFGRRAA